MGGQGSSPKKDQSYFKDLLNKKMGDKRGSVGVNSNPLGIVMGPSGGDNDYGSLPGLNSALQGLSSAGNNASSAEGFGGGAQLTSN
jgi:hypothetical protein